MKRFFLILAIAVVMTALTDAKAYAAPAVEDPLDNIELPSVLQKTFAMISTKYVGLPAPSLTRRKEQTSS